MPDESRPDDPVEIRVIRAEHQTLKAFLAGEQKTILKQVENMWASFEGAMDRQEKKMDGMSSKLDGIDKTLHSPDGGLVPRVARLEWQREADEKASKFRKGIFGAGASALVVLLLERIYRVVAG